MEVVRADKQPIQVLWKPGIMIRNSTRSRSLIIRKDGVPRKAYMDSKGFVEIQKEETKLLKVTTILPHRPMSSPIIEEIDDD